MKARAAVAAVWLAAAVAGGCGKGTPGHPRDASGGGAPDGPSADAPLPPAPDGPAPRDAAVDIAGPRDAPVDAAPGSDAARDTRDAGDTGSPGDAGPAGDGPPAAGGCNGHQALCDRRFDQVVFPSTHNAMSNSDDGWLGANQQHGITRQLADGIRGLLIDTHSYRGTSYLCHSNCIFGSKPLVDGLTEITRFLRANPGEVLMLIIEDGVSPADHDKAFTDSGLAAFLYTHTAGRPWPTLREMIASGQRVVVGAERGRPPPAWFHHVWDLVWDTPYTFRNKDEFSCRLNRGKAANELFLLNHWIENPLPSQSLSEQANTRAVLLGRARQCQQESGKLPNFVAVNHYASGDLFAVVRELNGL